MGTVDKGKVLPNAHKYTSNGATTSVGTMNQALSPRNVTLTSPSPGVIVVTWTPNPANRGSVLGYRVERRNAGPGRDILIERTVDDCPVLTDDTVVTGTTYFYRVSTLTAEGFSPVSSEPSIQAT